MWQIIKFDIFPFAIGALIGLYLIGCSAPQMQRGWMPSTKHEMKILIGQTTMEAIHAYRQVIAQEKVPVPNHTNDPERKY